MTAPGSEPAPAGPRVGWRPGAYDRAVPSTRLRSLLPVRHLARAGWAATLVPRDGSGRFDCVVFQKAFSEEDVALAQRLSAGGVRVVVDLCDNYLANPYDRPDQAARRGRLERLLDLADTVTVSTAALAEALAPRPAVVVDDALDLPRGASAWAWRPAVGGALRRRRGRPFRLVWFGTAGSETFSFGLSHLAPVLPVLDRLHRSRPLELTVISNSRPLFDRHVGDQPFPCRYVPWQGSSFARRFTAHDLCLIPIESNPFTVCKTGNRLLLALALGMPTVASPIPSYLELAPWTRFEDWEANIVAYRDDPASGRRHVEGARAHIRSRYTPARVVEQWSGVLERTLGAGSRG